MKEIIMFDNQYNCRRKCKIVSEQTTVSINYYNLYDSLYSIYVVRAYEFADKNRNLFIRQDFTIEDLLFELEILSDKIIISIYYPASSTIPTTGKPELTASFNACWSAAGSVTNKTSGSTYERRAGLVSDPGINLPTAAFAPIASANNRAGLWPY